jgi:HPt (histidine-containing phosphotransfer) domain-containing protein
VDGVDVAKGLANIGGDPETYLKVLAIFVKDVNERIPVFKKEANMENIRDFQLQVHAIKSAAANIGAAELSGEAKRLEEAAMNDDLDAINGDGPGFLSLLTEIRDNIQASLGKDPTETDAAVAGPAGKVNIEREILVTLKEAIDSRDIGTIDKILYGLSTRENDDETKETIDRISNHVLLADYDEAGLLVRIHLSRESRVI